MKNKSLQAKSNARLAAAQLLYRAREAEPMSAERLMREYQTWIESGTKEMGLSGVKPHAATLKGLLEGVAAHDAALDGLVSEHLKEGWKKERVNPLAIILLKLGFYELDAHRSLPTPVIIDEYTNLAARLLNDEEVGFVHATLKEAAGKIRE